MNINQLNQKINGFFKNTPKDELISYGAITFGVLLILIGIIL